MHNLKEGERKEAVLNDKSLRRSVSEGDFSSGRGYNVYPIKRRLSRPFAVVVKKRLLLEITA
jgi:hypothetical protein